MNCPVSPLYDVHFHPQEGFAGLNLEAGHPPVAIANGTGPKDWGAVAEICQQNDWVKPAYGLHPQAVAEVSPDWRGTLQRWLDLPGVVGIGEIGLDRNLPESTHAAQQEAFEWQWQLAAERRLPVMVHCVKAWGMLKDSLSRLPQLERGFLLHGYSGSAEMVEGFAAMGAWFSFSATVKDTRRKKQQLALQKVPLNRLLVETDGPVAAEYIEVLTDTYREIARQRTMAETEFQGIVARNWRNFVG
jgi:TatD DNase family protein